MVPNMVLAPAHNVVGVNVVAGDIGPPARAVVPGDVRTN